MVLTYLMSLDQIHLRGVNPRHFLFLVLYALLVVWEQATWEELAFRGLMIRWICKNQVGFTKKAFILLVVTAVAFAMGHTGNREVTSQSGIQAALAIASYGVTGLMFLVVDLYFGSLMPWLPVMVYMILDARKKAAAAM